MLAFSRGSLRIIAGISCLLFLAAQEAWAAPFCSTSSVFSSPTFSPHQIEVPSSLATLLETYQAPPNPLRSPKEKLVIYIQDIHTSRKVQEEIAELIQFYVRRYGVDFVAYEGNQGPIDTGKVFWYPDKNLKQAVSRKFLDQLRLSGPEYAHTNSEIPFQLWGMEEKTLYDKNLKAFQNALRIRQETLNLLNEIERDLVKGFDKASSPQGRQLFKLEEDYREGRLDMADYVRELVRIAGERSSFLDNMTKMNARDFFKALGALEKKAETLSWVLPIEQTIHQALKDLRMLRHMAEFSATRGELDQYWEFPHRFREKIFGELIDRVLGKKEDPSRPDSHLDDLMKDINQFYLAARERDEILARNGMKTSGKEKISIWVTGGFHAPGITRQFREAGVSYVVLVPQLDAVDKTALKTYEASIRDTVSSFNFRNPNLLNQPWEEARLSANAVAREIAPRHLLPLIEEDSRRLLPFRSPLPREAEGEGLRVRVEAVQPSPLPLSLGKGEGHLNAYRAQRAASLGDAGSEESFLFSDDLCPPYLQETLLFPENEVPGKEEFEVLYIDWAGRLDRAGGEPMTIKGNPGYQNAYYMRNKKKIDEIFTLLILVWDSLKKVWPAIFSNSGIAVVMDMPHSIIWERHHLKINLNILDRSPVFLAALMENLNGRYLMEFPDLAAVKLFAILESLKILVELGGSEKDTEQTRIEKAEFRQKLQTKLLEAERPRYDLPAFLKYFLDPDEKREKHVFSPLMEDPKCKELVFRVFKEAWPEGETEIERLENLSSENLTDLLKRVGRYKVAKQAAERIRRLLLIESPLKEFPAYVKELNKFEPDILREVLSYFARRGEGKIFIGGIAEVVKIEQVFVLLWEAMDPNRALVAITPKNLVDMLLILRKMEAVNRSKEGDLYPIRENRPYLHIDQWVEVIAKNGFPEFPGYPRQKIKEAVTLYNVAVRAKFGAASLGEEAAGRIPVAEHYTSILARARERLAEISKDQKTPPRLLADEELNRRLLSERRMARRTWEEAVRFLSEAQNPSGWTFESDEDHKLALQYAHLSDEELEREIEAIHPGRSYRPREINWEHFRVDMWGNLIATFLTLESLPDSARAQLHKTNVNFRKPLIAFREWVYRYFDENPRPPSHSLFANGSGRASSLGAHRPQELLIRAGAEDFDEALWPNLIDFLKKTQNKNIRFLVGDWVEKDRLTRKFRSFKLPPRARGRVKFEVNKLMTLHDRDALKKYVAHRKGQSDFALIAEYNVLQATSLEGMIALARDKVIRSSDRLARDLGPREKAKAKLALFDIAWALLDSGPEARFSDRWIWDPKTQILMMREDFLEEWLSHRQMDFQRRQEMLRAA